MRIKLVPLAVAAMLLVSVFGAVQASARVMPLDPCISIGGDTCWNYADCPIGGEMCGGYSNCHCENIL